LIKMIPKHIFWPIIDCFSMQFYVTGVTRIQGVVSRRSSPNQYVWSILLKKCIGSANVCLIFSPNLP